MACSFPLALDRAPDGAPDKVAYGAPTGAARGPLQPTRRHIDRDGNMYVTRSNISKAQIRTYKGSEIPQRQELGLDPACFYRLLCPAQELAKAAPSFCLKPLFMGHVPHSADNPPKEKIIGTIGENVSYEDPYLVASLNITDAQARRAIESGEIRELSPGYYYRPDMTPGIYEGEPYDGVMRDIVGNHLALVPKGRSGPDVMVADHDLFYIPPLKESEMKNITPRDWAVIGAVKKSLYGSMAMDAAGRIDLPALFVSAAAATRPERMALFAKIATQAFMKVRTGLALSAPPPKEEEVNKAAQEADDPDLPDAYPPDDACVLFDKRSTNEDIPLTAISKPVGKAGDQLRTHPKGEHEDQTPKKDENDDMMGKDEAMRMIDQATQKLKAQMAVNQANLRRAEKLVRPLYGDMALDSAEAIYDSVLKNAGIAFDQSFPLAAKEALVAQHMAYKNALKHEKQASLAMDQATLSDRDRLGISAFQGGTR